MTKYQIVSEKDVLQFSLLSNKITDVIDNYEENKELNDIELKILNRGKLFLESIIKGSLLLNQKGEMEGLHPSAEGLSNYKYALSVLKQLSQISQKKENFKMLLGFRNDLNLLINKEDINQSNLNLTKEFFELLSELLSEELHKKQFFN